MTTQRIRDRTTRSDHVYGNSRDNAFDCDRGGNDHIYGRGGNDTYYLGAGTDHDVVYENRSNPNPGGDSGDKVVVEGSFTALHRHADHAPRTPLGRRASLRRSNNGRDLHIEILAADGSREGDSLTIKDHYADTTGAAKIESVEFADGTSWNAIRLSKAEIMGTSSNDHLYGLGTTDDWFDSDAGGNDKLYGYGGNDVYWLGRGTGHDVINEASGNADGDTGDMICTKVGLTVDSFRLRRSNNGRDLIMELLTEGEATDSLTVKDYYVYDNAKIEVIEITGSGNMQWTETEMMLAEIVGTGSNDYLYGRENSEDVFNGNAGGNDRLYGYSGDDTYTLTFGTDHDTVNESYRSGEGDTGDTILVNRRKTVDGTLVTGTVSYHRSNNGNDLIVSLADTDGSISDTLTVKDFYKGPKYTQIEFVKYKDQGDDIAMEVTDLLAVEIVGGAGNDYLYGKNHLDDVFNSNAGGNDRLYGYSGDDTYILTFGTEHDTVNESYRSGDGDTGDTILVKRQKTTADGALFTGTVSYHRSNNGNDLIVSLKGNDGEFRDKLTVKDFYQEGRTYAQVEYVKYEDQGDDIAMELPDLLAVEIRGGTGNDYLYGKNHLDDVFNSNAGGDDRLYGYRGNDTYTLTFGTGDDTVYESYRSGDGDTADTILVIRQKTINRDEIYTGEVSYHRSIDGQDLIVSLTDSDGVIRDKLTVPDFYREGRTYAQIEYVKYEDQGDDDIAMELPGLLAAEIKGTTANENLYGQNHLDDVFDGGGGRDNLYGYGGDDTYIISAATGRSTTVYEAAQNGETGNADIIRIRKDDATDKLELKFDIGPRDLVVELRDLNDQVVSSITIHGFYQSDAAKVERIERDGMSFDLAASVGAYNIAVANFMAGNSGFETLRDATASFWQGDSDTLLDPPPAG